MGSPSNLDMVLGRISVSFEDLSLEDIKHILTVCFDYGILRGWIKNLGGVRPLEEQLWFSGTKHVDDEKEVLKRVWTFPDGISERTRCLELYCFSNDQSTRDLFSPEKGSANRVTLWLAETGDLLISQVEWNDGKSPKDQFLFRVVRRCEVQKLEKELFRLVFSEYKWLVPVILDRIHLAAFRAAERNRKRADALSHISDEFQGMSLRLFGW